LFAKASVARECSGGRENRQMASFRKKRVADFAVAQLAMHQQITTFRQLRKPAKMASFGTTFRDAIRSGNASRSRAIRLRSLIFWMAMNAVPALAQPWFHFNA